MQLLLDLLIPHDTALALPDSYMHSAVENQQDLQAAFLFQYSTPHQDNEIYHAELQSGILTKILIAFHPEMTDSTIFIEMNF